MFCEMSWRNHSPNHVWDGVIRFQPEDQILPFVLSWGWVILHWFPYYTFLLPLIRALAYAAVPWASQVALVVKICLPMQETKRLTFYPWVRKIPWRRRAWPPTTVFLLENPMGRWAWWDMIHGVAKNRIWLKQISVHTHTHTCYALKEINPPPCG